MPPKKNKVLPTCFGFLTLGASACAHYYRRLQDYFMAERGMQIKLGDRPEELFPDAEFVGRWQLKSGLPEKYPIPP